MAQSISMALAAIAGIEILAVDTNMVFLSFAKYEGDAAAALQAAGILTAVQAGPSRMVTHLDLPADTPERLVTALTI